MSAGTLTIVAYHYVRDVEGTAHPGIKALSVADFAGQLDYLARHYAVVSASRVMAAVAGHEARALPPRAALLTFDDGYIDHVHNVLPLLRARKLPAVFFPSVGAIAERRVLDVNKIHFILAAADTQDVLDALYGLLDEQRHAYGLDANEAYWSRWGKAGRWDSAEAVFVKRMLQKGLPAPARRRIVDLLFRRFVTADEAGFAAELYMSEDDLETVMDAGMAIGCHGYAHEWLDALEASEQEEDIDRALAFLSALGADTRDWMMCYPYGAHDDRLLALVAAKGCRAGVTVRPGIARPGADNPLLLPRLDTNDLPKHRDAELSRWTLDAA